MYDRVMVHMGMSHVKHMHEWFHTYKRVISHVWISHAILMNESCHTCVSVMSHNESRHVLYRPFKRVTWLMTWVIRVPDTTHPYWWRDSCSRTLLSPLVEECTEVFLKTKIHLQKIFLFLKSAQSYVTHTHSCEDSGISYVTHTHLMYLCHDFSDSPVWMSPVARHGTLTHGWVMPRIKSHVHMNESCHKALHTHIAWVLSEWVLPQDMAHIHMNESCHTSWHTCI